MSTIIAAGPIFYLTFTIISSSLGSDFPWSRRVHWSYFLFIFNFNWLVIKYNLVICNCLLCVSKMNLQCYCIFVKDGILHAELDVTGC